MPFYNRTTIFKSAAQGIELRMAREKLENQNQNAKFWLKNELSFFPNQIALHCLCLEPMFINTDFMTDVSFNNRSILFEIVCVFWITSCKNFLRIFVIYFL